MRSIVVLIVLALTAGCAKKAAEATAPAPPAAKPTVNVATTTAPAPPPPTSPSLATVSGTVIETIDASDYTYMRLKVEGGEIWAAVTKARVQKGQAVTVVNAMSMDGFESKTLNRKFDRLVFGSLADPAVAPAAASMATGHQSADVAKAREQMAAQHGQAAGGPDDTPDVKVPKAEGANAKTVADVWAQRSTLKGKDVAVKAKVVKVTPGVMGKNWLHVRDGSGSKAAKDNDLTVTTGAIAKVGDVVTVSGRVAVDKDFGAGYVYPVILEDSKLAN